MFLKRVRALKITGNSAEYIDDPIAMEGPVSIYVNNELITVQVATLSDLKELGAGYVISEGISDKITSSEEEENSVYVYAEITNFSNKITESSGGTGFIRSVKKVSSEIKINSADIINATKEIISDTWKETGGVHCSVLFRNSDVICKMSDVGRHNTLDKIIGFSELNNINRSECYVGCTGRQPAGMVFKCANSGLPVIISKAASTQNGIKTADDSGITLICFARGDRYTIYSHPQRIMGIDFP
ncbi:MAG: formate dehydrogenase accessory sulfurtransferase FdhD [Methanomicrobium sp.]|nr:formate dehydrogenase accessory sulfurtransferase FdhD [Methanomicrobium sp.]